MTPTHRSHCARARNFTLPALLAAQLMVVCVAVAPAQNIALSALGTVHPGFRIDGSEPYDISGRSVSGAGDVNGDGLADLIVGAYAADQNTTLNTGASYVVFGKTDTTPVSLSSLGAGGFRIDGIDAGDLSGFSVSGAGDVNGDGLADLIVGAFGADPNAEPSAGESYVVFGKSDSAAVSLSALGLGGFRIDGIDIEDSSGRSVSGAGDVNGDGFADLLIGAFKANVSAGHSYVVFGKTGSTSVSLASLGTAGFRIDGIDTNDSSGESVSGAGDVNGDGLADIIVGASRAEPNGIVNAGESYVIFGKTGSAAVSLAALGAGGFRITGADSGDQSGKSVAGAGDVNGDGFADLIVGAYNADLTAPARVNAGRSYVVFGKTNTTAVSLGSLGAGGFSIDGIDANDSAGTSVSGAGDVNGDGLADLVIGASGADPNGADEAGESYVVFGKTGSTAVSLAALGAGGFRVDGIDAFDGSGYSVSGAGDVNGDGLADLIVGAFYADPNDNTSAGESYVIFSTATPPASATYKATAGSGNSTRVAIGSSGDGSDDSTPAARAWIDFADGAAASTETVRIMRNNSELTGLTAPANVAWEVTSDRTGWTAAEVTFKYLDSEIVGHTEANLQLYKAPAASGPWTVQTTTVNTAKNTVSATVNGFSYFALTSGPLTVGEWSMLEE